MAQRTVWASTSSPSSTAASKRVAGDVLGARAEREQGRVAGEVGGRAAGRGGQIRRLPHGEPRAGETEGEDLLERALMPSSQTALQCGSRG